MKSLLIPDIECTTHTFKCMNGIPACIPTSWVCDGHHECFDGSDESPDICGEHYIYYKGFQKLFTEEYNYLPLKEIGHVMRTNSLVVVVIQDAYQRQGHATSWEIVQMRVMRLENFVVSNFQ